MKKESSLENSGVQQALQKIKEVADQLNEAKRKAENANRVATIQNSLIDKVKKKVSCRDSAD